LQIAALDLDQIDFHGLRHECVSEAGGNRRQDQQDKQLAADVTHKKQGAAGREQGAAGLAGPFGSKRTKC
jgi:hypothetical protein